MKRFHVHLHVTDLQASIDFYSRLFAADPVRVERDYAKWMVDDPRLNFAISTRGVQPGIDHLGIQTDSLADLAAMKVRAECADMVVLDEGQTTCCYARSQKHWVVDPQGMSWEHFHTIANLPVYAADTADAGGHRAPVERPATNDGAEAAPKIRSRPVGAAVE